MLKKIKVIVYIFILSIIPMIISYNNVFSLRNPIATIQIENYGDIKIELYPKIAPNTVNNFIYLANTGFYDGLKFHRVIKGFMAQAGCPKGNGSGNAGYFIKGEFSANGIENNLKHEKGIVSMARSSGYNTASSQFFIMDGTAEHLDGLYSGFGKVISGYDILNKITNTPVDNNDMPVKDITINKITIDTKGVHYKLPTKIR